MLWKYKYIFFDVTAQTLWYKNTPVRKYEYTVIDGINDGKPFH